MVTCKVRNYIVLQLILFITYNVKFLLNRTIAIINNLTTTHSYLLLYTYNFHPIKNKFT